jgi:excisionase family DNA binding protein
MAKAAQSDTTSVKAAQKSSAKKSSANKPAAQGSEAKTALVSVTEVADFTREFAAQIDDGKALVPSLSALADRQQNPHFQEIIRSVNVAVRAGHTLSSALARFPDVFDAAYIDAVRVGEVNGTLDQMLHGLSHGDDILTLDQAIQFLGTSKPTIYRLLSQGTLKGLRVGRQWRFRKRDLATYMERKPEPVAVAAGQELDAEYQFFTGRLHEINPDRSEGQTEIVSDDEKVIAIDNAILAIALNMGASDIHLEATRLDGQICTVLRFRTDGVLQEIRRMPARLFNSLAGRFKVMADVNPAQRDLPQDGRMHIQHKDKQFDVRLATCPSAYGESVVMRILDQSNVQVALEQLQFAPEDLERLRGWLNRPNGMVIVTGPTGSGKTTVLYSCLNEINLPDRKIITIEDPVEYALPGVIQVHVNRKAGLTFATALRAFLRQDPDIIMAGEIRELETAELAAQAALTGHTLLSTLHVNSAIEAVLRLREMGLEPFIISASLVGVSAQRLARRICPNCKEEAASGAEIPAPVRKLARDGGYPIPQGAQFYHGRGCDTCRQTGYRGRIPLYELMSWSEPLATAFTGGASREELTYLAIEGGMKTMMADGVRKAEQGETTIEELQRVLGVAL